MRALQVVYTDCYVDTILDTPVRSFALSMEWLAFGYLLSLNRNMLQDIF